MLASITLSHTQHEVLSLSWGNRSDALVLGASRDTDKTNGGLQLALATKIKHDKLYRRRQ